MLDLSKIKLEEKTYACDICKDMSYVKSDENDFDFFEENGEFINGKLVITNTYYKRCKCELQKRFERKLEQAGLGAIREKILNVEYKTTYQWQKDAYDVAKRFVTNDNKGLIISGQTGSGKTLLLSKMLYNFAVKGKDIMYFAWYKNYSSQLVDRYNVINQDLLRKMLEIDVLYIDDLFKTRDNSMDDIYNKRQEIEVFWQIIDARAVDSTKKTMISTELLESDFLKLDEALWGRMLELVESMEFWVQMNPKENRNIRALKAMGEFK